jgi:hypothetical protein
MDGWGDWVVAGLVLLAGVQAFAAAKRADSWSWRLFGLMVGLAGVLAVALYWSVGRAAQAASDAGARLYLLAAVGLLVFGTGGIIWYVNRLYRRRKQSGPDGRGGR